MQQACDTALARFRGHPCIVRGRFVASIISKFVCVPVDRAKGEIAILCPPVPQEILAGIAAIPLELPVCSCVFA